jgi:hypothetical protein
MPLGESDNPLRKIAERLGGGWRRERRGVLREWLVARRDRYLATDEQRRRAGRIGLGAGALAIVAAGLGAYFALRPTPEPDYLNDDLLVVLDFTFLQKEFNALPLDRRMELLGMFVKRIESMSAGESVLMAAFAGSVAGKAREQFEENVSRFMIDMWDQHAMSYASVPAEQKETFLADALVEMEKAMEAVGGSVRDKPDHERLANMKRQAARDQEMLRSGRGPGATVMGRLYDVVNNDIGGHANPQERLRGQQMARDSVRFLRGQDLATGKPKGGG